MVRVAHNAPHHKQARTHAARQPQDEEVSKEDVFAKSRAGHVMKRGEQVTERWHYRRSTGSLTMIVKIATAKSSASSRRTRS